MDLHVRIEGQRDLAKQIFEQVRTAILVGRLAPGERLPPTRELARHLAVSRNTVSLAYELLTAQGLVSGRAGAGSFVEAKAHPELRKRCAPRISPLPCRPLWSQIPRDLAKTPSGAFDFRPGLPDADAFPYNSWRRLVAKQLTPRGMNGRYGDSAGHPGLREAIATYFGAARGVQATADDVIVTCGAQHGLDLIGRVLIEPGTRVAIEDPGYAPARLLFESLSANVVGVGVDEQGLIVDSLPDDARVVYVTPAHQYPLGVSMSESRRAALLRWARERNAVVIEDDYDSELRFGGRPADTLQAMDRTGCVVHLGTFSKTMLPCLRLGFVIAPESLREPLKTALFVSSRHCHWPTQAAMAEFIKEGLFARHVRKMRREYARRHHRIVEVLRSDFAAWFEPIAGVVGMHVSAFLRLPADDEAKIAAHAEAAGIGLQRLSPFYSQQPSRAGITLGYGAIASERIDEGLQELRRSVELAIYPS